MRMRRFSAEFLFSAIVVVVVVAVVVVVLEGSSREEDKTLVVSSALFYADQAKDSRPREENCSFTFARR